MPQTDWRKVNPDDPDPATLRHAAEVLKRGGLVVVPTETVYGLAANAFVPSTVARIFYAKGRPATNPVIVHVPSAQAACSLVKEWPESAERLAERYWPGPLTIVLPKSDAIPSIVTAGGPTVALRVPAHPVILRLLEICPFPLAAPSANRSQRLSPTTADHVRADLDGEVHLVLDAGPTDAGIESTVIDLTGPPRILRPGPIDRHAIETILGTSVATSAGVAQGSEPARSPGMMDRHYAPRTPLVCSDRAAEVAAELRQSGKRIGWLALEKDAHAEVGVLVTQMPDEPAEYARRLYAELHEMDRRGVDVILVSLPPDEARWEAVRDRLRRARS